MSLYNLFLVREDLENFIKTHSQSKKSILNKNIIDVFDRNQKIALEEEDDIENYNPYI